MKKILIIFICSLSFGSLLMAQNPIHWSVNIGGSFPTGGFGTMSYDKNTMVSDCGLFDEEATNGGAGLGLSIGTEMVYTLKEQLDFTLSADLHYNTINDELKSLTTAVGNYMATAFQQQVISNGGTSVTSSCSLDRNPSYINIPLTAGVKFTIPLSNDMNFFASCGVGMNIRIITPLKYTARVNYLYGGYNYVTNINETFSYSTKGTIAFRIGGELQFTERLSVSAFYYYLGKGDVFATIRAEDADGNTQPYVQNMELGSVTPMMFVLRLGLNL